MAKKKLDEIRTPKGELVIRTIAMPADTNSNGDIFGGWVMSQMDIGAGIIAKKVAKRRVTTVAVEGMSFLHPVNVGDLVSCYANLEQEGNTSVQISVEVWVQRGILDDEVCVTEGLFTYVAIDENGRPIPIKRKYNIG